MKTFLKKVNGTAYPDMHSSSAEARFEAKQLQDLDEQGGRAEQQSVEIQCLTDSKLEDRTALKDVDDD